MCCVTYRYYNWKVILYYSKNVVAYRMKINPKCMIPITRFYYILKKTIYVFTVHLVWILHSIVSNFKTTPSYLCIVWYPRYKSYDWVSSFTFYALVQTVIQPIFLNVVSCSLEVFIFRHYAIRKLFNKKRMSTVSSYLFTLVQYSLRLPSFFVLFSYSSF